jgi:hypothetical protein
MGNRFTDSIDIVFQKISRKIVTMINLFETAIVENVTYEEIMKYFIAHKYDDDKIVSGLLIKEVEEGGYTILIQMFLDKENNSVCRENGIPLGRRLKMPRLDDELLKAFKNKDCIIVT